MKTVNVIANTINKRKTLTDNSFINVKLLDIVVFTFTVKIGIRWHSEKSTRRRLFTYTGMLSNRHQWENRLTASALNLNNNYENHRHNL